MTHLTGQFTAREEQPGGLPAAFVDERGMRRAGGRTPAASSAACHPATRRPLTSTSRGPATR